VRNLYGITSVATGTTVVYTVGKNGVATALTATQGSAATTFSDSNSAHSFSVVAGDLLSVSAAATENATGLVSLSFEMA
jgi:hypothetical protein